MDPFLEDLSWKYLRMFPVRDINWKDFKDILNNLECSESLSFQKDLMTKTINHYIARKYPPTATYTRMFLKEIIEQTEGSNQEVCEEMYLSYTELLSQSVNTQSEHCYRTYRLNSDCVVTMKETRKLITNGTTGMFTWEASHVLAEWCCKNSHLFRNKKVLELGSGLGLMGLVVIKSCKPAGYTFTDLPSAVLSSLAENVNINLEGVCEGSETLNTNDWTVGVKTSHENTKIDIRRLDWEQDSCNYKTDVILAADVVYEPVIIASLVSTLKTALSKNPGAIAIIASTVRNSDTYTLFRETLEKMEVQICHDTCQSYQESASRPESSVNLLQLTL